MPGISFVEDADAARALAAEILSPERTRTIVAVTTRAGSSRPGFDLEPFERQLASVADLYVIPTGEPTWELAEHLPERLEVYGGALRVWWPGVRADSDPYEHPLFFIQSDKDAERRPRELVELVRARVDAGERARRPEPGEVVEAVVTEIVPYGAFLEVDGHRGLVHVSELADGWVEDPGEIVEVGDEVRALVLPTDGDRLAFSFRESRERPREPEAVARAETTRRAEEAVQLREEVRGLRAERRDLLAERIRLRDRIRELERGRREERAARHPVAVASDADFRSLLAAEYERRYVGDDRRRYPLGDYALNPRFLETVRALGGIAVEKVAEVCAHVVTGRAREFAGLQLHPLRSGDGGAPQRVRSRDGAKAWRCALQVGTPSARRLHWWALPGGGVELASVGIHDDLDIPE